MTCWLHRISHEPEVSYRLFEMGYLSLGWRRFIDADIELLRSKFDDFMRERGESSRSRFCLRNFLAIKPGDTIVVPLPDGRFSVVRALSDAFQARAGLLPDGFGFETAEGVRVTAASDGLRSAAKRYDIGFLLRFERLREPIPRSFAHADLISRMKMFQTNADISDCAVHIEAALSAKAPVDLHEKLAGIAAKALLDSLSEHATPDALERVVAAYMKKKGADSVVIPPKNEPGKTGLADCDVRAVFEPLRLVFFIQVKRHTGETDSHAVRQIAEYTEARSGGDGFTYIPWVISTAKFDARAELEAYEHGVRLIDGEEISRMLLDCGISGI